MNPLETVEIARRQMSLFFIVDTSGSMDGEKIAAVNTAIREVLPEIADISSENADAQIKVACLQFDNSTQWLFKPTDVEGLTWSDLSANGMTVMGEAFNELNSKLSRNEFLNSPTGNFAPVLFLMSDGQPTDEYRKALDSLRENRWFKVAIRVAIAIGDDADMQVLTEFTGNPELVLTAHTPEALKQMIRFVSVTSSKIGSRSSGIGVGGGNTNSDSESKQEEFAEQVKDFKENADLEALSNGF
ncbi:MAG: VWA domain-containing protein [Paludibacteraceae bacterium]|nr:VWA domain-containing protein [Paludibacteraceae bacterium]